MDVKQYALILLHQMLGEDKEFRPGQWEAIEAVVVQRKRVLVVQCTGWGKSLVYFLATKLLRDLGSGPTLLISPLLSLMRNQIDMAGHIGLNALSINSANTEEWEQVEKGLKSDQCDLLLISPERLNNEHFLKTVLPMMSGSIGLFVVDEAHCISDWGHDFRPDYRRITRILQKLPKGIPVLGTTATANNRVMEDIQLQLGTDLTILRGSLVRPSLRLQNIPLANQNERYAWLAENLPRLKGSGIIYCLTVPDTERVTKWLKHKGYKAEAYHAGSDTEIDRPALEQAFLNNDIQILVATVALGMGFDKPDISFVIHFQRPGSVIAYYQQVGRAGRAVDRAYGILLSGAEDDEVQTYFIETAFPSAQTMQEILAELEKNESLSLFEILARVNTSASMAEKALKLLEMDGAVSETFDKKVLYFRTANRWKPDTERIERVLALRRAELAQMQAYMQHKGCLMEFLQQALDDSDPRPCGRCANCQGKGLPTAVSAALVVEAENFHKSSQIFIQPRLRFPSGLLPVSSRSIPPEEQNSTGRVLCHYGDAGWGILVRDGKYLHNHFSDELIIAAAELVRDIWHPEPFPEWVTAIPSNRRPVLVSDFTSRLAKRLDIPFLPLLKRSGNPPEQKTMQNSAMQARNVLGTMTIDGKVPAKPVLLVDDIVDSGWTLAVAGHLLKTSGSGTVYPFALAQATPRRTL